MTIRHFVMAAILQRSLRKFPTNSPFKQIKLVHPLGINAATDKLITPCRFCDVN